MQGRRVRSFDCRGVEANLGEKDSGTKSFNFEVPEYIFLSHALQKTLQEYVSLKNHTNNKYHLNPISHPSLTHL